MEMAATTAAFDSYKIFYYTDRPFAPFQAMIYCYRGSEDVGRIIFYPDGNVPMSGEASLHYPFSRFHDVVTMLRYEKPLYLWWDSYTEGEQELTWGMISTSEQEPAGEEEP
jgi:hypothetical protein